MDKAIKYYSVVNMLFIPNFYIVSHINTYVNTINQMAFCHSFF
ncbi:hypothetical protein ASZ90_019921 [hydrocarbon metagenome]|uniref:Uncharacterized protein n=1 Tax=hydrocarbon metagenome TaxID=938273 RepID=A0A0W8E216_9ZZZZ